MAMPGFSAEDSLYQTHRSYRSASRTAQASGTIHPAISALRVGGGLQETTCDTSCCAWCSCCANKGDMTCCNNCGANCPKNVAIGGGLAGLGSLGSVLA